MPIDFEEIVAGFEKPLKAQTKQLVPLFAALAKAFKKWNTQSIEAERATRDIPIVDFKFGGVSLHLQNTIGEPSDLGDDLVRGGGAFVDGLSFIPTAVTQELLLLRMVQAGATVSGRLAARTEDMLALRPSMFDATDSSFFDLPALGALGVAIADEAGFVPSMNDESSTGTEGPTAEPQQTLEQLIDAFVDYTLAAFLVLPAATTILGAHATALSAAGQVAVLQALSSVEYQLLDFRGGLLQSMLEITDIGEIVRFWIDPLIGVLSVDVAIMVGWVPETVDGLLGYIVDIVEIVDLVARVLSPILRFIVDVFMFLLDMDLLFAIPGVTLTIGDVIFHHGRAFAASLGINLKALAVTIWPVSRKDSRIYNQLGNMFVALGGHNISPAEGPPTPALTPVPDVASMVLTPRLETAITEYLWSTGPPLGRSIAAAADAAGRAITDLGTATDGVAQRSLQGVDQLGGMARQAISLTDTIMADEVARAEADVADAQVANDPGLAFVSTASFAAGALMPHYVLSFRRLLERRRFEPRDPSPHILARRARLVGVQSAKMTVTMGSADTDDATADQVAVALRQEFSNLYRQGVSELDRAAAAAEAG